MRSYLPHLPKSSVNETVAATTTVRRVSGSYKDGGVSVIVRRNSTRIPPCCPQSGAVTAEKPIPRIIGQEFGTLAGPASRRDLTGRKSGPNSQS
ncbi:hypothetical protein T265_04451 [Opisthorchis viverrini]|uniref:Uncharacterized protein n=1 Tax=Opisthorchis viverrini TaxID=6198 RepID=A0A074ZZP8_OPIVI|nr:hypothetical protein T265_04451 [Opisthorchis viverrini]KER28760.1 hypothetical protein T265_04451 [Opisthorchis viverrini]